MDVYCLTFCVLWRNFTRESFLTVYVKKNGYFEMGIVVSVGVSVMIMMMLRAAVMMVMVTVFSGILLFEELMMAIVMRFLIRT